MKARKNQVLDHQGEKVSLITRSLFLERKREVGEED